jgi:hypothetical protein
MDTELVFCGFCFLSCEFQLKAAIAMMAGYFSEGFGLSRNYFVAQT